MPSGGFLSLRMILKTTVELQGANFDCFFMWVSSFFFGCANDSRADRVLNFSKFWLEMIEKCQVLVLVGGDLR